MDTRSPIKSFKEHCRILGFSSIISTIGQLLDEATVQRKEIFGLIKDHYIRSALLLHPDKNPKQTRIIR